MQHYPSAYEQTFARQAALPWNWTLCLHDILQSTWPSVVLAGKALEPVMSCAVSRWINGISRCSGFLSISSLSNRRSSSRFAHSMTLTQEVKVASCCATVGRTRLCLLLHPLLLHRPHCSQWVRPRAFFSKGHMEIVIQIRYREGVYYIHASDLYLCPTLCVSFSLNTLL